MEAEQLEVLNFISQYPPFDDLPEEQLRKIALNAEVAYFRQGTKILNFGDTIRDLYMVRSGAVEIYRRKGELYNRIDAGGLFGQMGLFSLPSLLPPLFTRLFHLPLCYYSLFIPPLFFPSFILFIFLPFFHSPFTFFTTISRRTVLYASPLVTSHSPSLSLIPSSLLPASCVSLT